MNIPFNQHGYYLRAALLVGCILLVSSDQCFNSERVLAQIKVERLSAKDLFPSVIRGHYSPDATLIQYALDQEHDHWLQLLAQLNQSEALYYLALRYPDDARQKHWLVKAAELGSGRAQLLLSQHTTDKRQQFFWKREAADNGIISAQIEVAAIYEAMGAEQQSLKYLQAAAQEDASSARKIALHLWQQAQYDSASMYFRQAASLGDSQAQTYLQLIDLYWRAAPYNEGESQKIPTAMRGAEKSSHCVIQLQFVATGLQQAKLVDQFIASFEQDSRLSDLPICMNELVWLSEQQLRCEQGAHADMRASCDEIRLSQALQHISFTHGVLVTRRGKAHVTNGLMYLDINDTYDVFVHELAHFAGFADEYPLNSELAEKVCSGVHAPNLVIADARMGGTENQTSDSQSGLFPARTCDNHDRQAFKLSAQTTFMEFHDVRNIPENYLQIWLQKLKQRRELIPAYVNFSQAYNANGDDMNARKWWQLYIDYIGVTHTADRAL